MTTIFFHEGEARELPRSKVLNKNLSLLVKAQNIRKAFVKLRLSLIERMTTRRLLMKTPRLSLATLVLPVA